MDSDAVILETLQEKYFDLCREEDIGKTPALTKRIDKLEKAIRREVFTKQQEETVFGVS